uniref:ULP_PROTEASE domain-containing protein n=1 Tax=Panagrellus redivivus TaxID=6233 RepID=A0A7E4VPJ1_PANRE
MHNSFNSALVPTTSQYSAEVSPFQSHSYRSEKLPHQVAIPHVKASYSSSLSSPSNSSAPYSSPYTRSYRHDASEPFYLRDTEKKDKFNDVEQYNLRRRKTSKNSDVTKGKVNSATPVYCHNAKNNDRRDMSQDEVDDIIKSFRRVHFDTNVGNTIANRESCPVKLSPKKPGSLKTVTKRIRQFFSKLPGGKSSKSSKADNAYKENCEKTKEWTCDQKISDNTLIPIPLRTGRGFPFNETTSETEFCKNDSFEDIPQTDDDASPDANATLPSSSKNCPVVDADSSVVKEVQTPSSTVNSSNADVASTGDNADSAMLFPTLDIMIEELKNSAITYTDWLSTFHIDNFLQLLNTVAKPPSSFCYVVSEYTVRQKDRRILDLKPCKKFVSHFDKDTEYCFVPVLEENHWTVFVLNIKKWTISHYDPQNARDRGHVLHFIFPLVQKLFSKSENPTIVTRTLPNSYLQPPNDNYNCGVFICHYMERIVFHGESNWRLMPRCNISQERKRLRDMFNAIVDDKVLPTTWTPAQPLFHHDININESKSPSPVNATGDSENTSLNDEEFSSTDNNFGKRSDVLEQRDGSSSSDAEHINSLLEPKTKLQQPALDSSIESISDRHLEIESQGHIYGYEQKLRPYSEYLPIFDEADLDRSICFGINPIQLPRGGTIVVYDLDRIRKEKFPKVKKMEEVRYEMHADLYSWGKNPGVRPMEEAKRVLLSCLDVNRKINDKFRRLEIWSLKYNFVLFHYIGDERVPAKGLRHLHSKHKTAPYVMGLKSVKHAIIERSAMGQKTNTIYNALHSKIVPAHLEAVGKPRNPQVVQNAVYNARYASHNTAFVLMIASGNLTWDKPVVGKEPRRFLTFFNVAMGEMVIHLVNFLAFDEIRDIQKKMPSEPIMLYYDTTFNLTDGYVSTLSMVHPYFNKIVVLAHMIHEKKYHRYHRDFLKALRDKNKCLQHGSFVLVTDDEFDFDRIWPNATHLLCFNHIKRAARKNLHEKNLSQQQVNDFITDIQHLQSLKSFDHFNDAVELLCDQERYGKNTAAGKLLRRLAPKVREKASVAALQRANVAMKVCTTNVAESLNAIIQRITGNDLVRLDNFVLLMYYHGIIQIKEMDRGYFLYDGSFILQPRYMNEAKGDRSDALPWRPQCPADDLVSYVINNERLFEQEVDDAYQEASRRWHGEDRANRTMNIMATTTGRVRQIAADEFLVTSQNGDRNVVLLVKAASSTKSQCSCRSTRTCLHVRAVMSTLKANIEDEGTGDVVAEVRITRKHQKRSGQKEPRVGDYEKDDPIDILHNTDYSDDDASAMTSKQVSQSAHQAECVAESTATNEPQVFADTEPYMDNCLYASMPPSIESIESKSEDFREEPDEPGENGISVLDQSDEINDITTNNVNLEAWNDYAVPEMVDTTMPSWANSFLTTKGLRGNTGNVLISADVYCPDFNNPLPLLAPNSIAMAKTTRDILFIVMRHRSTDSISASAYLLPMAKVVISNTELAEVGFHTISCCRDVSKKITIAAFNIPEKPTNDLEKWVLLVVKVQQLLAGSNPAANKIAFRSAAKIIKTSGKFDHGEYMKMAEKNVAVEPFKHDVMRLQRFCCCQRGHIDGVSDPRRADLNMDYMTQCFRCNKWYFNHCSNVITAEAKSLRKWLCFNCSAFPPLLPKWGAVKYSNTCPIDNFLAMCIIQVEQSKQFLKAINGADGANNFRYHLLEFLHSDRDTVSNLTKAKERFLAAVYKSKVNLFGSEEECVLSHFTNDYAIEVLLTCTGEKCNNSRSFIHNTLIHRYKPERIVWQEYHFLSQHILLRYCQLAEDTLHTMA